MKAQEDKAKCIGHEIREAFEIPEDKPIPDDVVDRYTQLTLLKNAYQLREIMQLTLEECRQYDAAAKSHSDKPNYVKRWLLFSVIKDVLGIKNTDMDMTKDILFKKDTRKIMKAIRENKKIYELWGYLTPKWNDNPMTTIKRILIKQLDLDVEYENKNYASREAQQAIIKHYIEKEIFQELFGVGKDGWATKLKSREKRWKAAQEDIDNELKNGKRFEELDKAQQAYYLEYSPHLKIANWKYCWTGNISTTEKADFFIINFNEGLSETETELTQQVMREFQ